MELLLYACSVTIFCFCPAETRCWAEWTLGWTRTAIPEFLCFTQASLHGAVLLSLIQINSQGVLDYGGLKGDESWNFETCKLKEKYSWHYKSF